MFVLATTNGKECLINTDHIAFASETTRGVDRQLVTTVYFVGDESPIGLDMCLADFMHVIGSTDAIHDARFKKQYYLNGGKK